MLKENVLILSQYKIKKDIYIYFRCYILLNYNKKSKLILVITVIYLIFFFALSSGIINAIIEGVNVPEGLTIVPSRSLQTISETIIITLILFVGVFGSFLVYRAGHSNTPKTQYGFLAGGLFVITMSLVLGLMIINIKLSL
jgi:hypothetical protein